MNRLNQRVKVNGRENDFVDRKSFDNIYTNRSVRPLFILNIVKEKNVGDELRHYNPTDFASLNFTMPAIGQDFAA